MHQVVVEGEILDANADAEEDLSFRIPPADFTGILEEAGIPAEAAAGLQATLFNAGYGRAMPWANPVRAELSALGIGSGFLDGVITEVKRYLLDSVGVAYSHLQALVGGGATTADMAKEPRVFRHTTRSRRSMGTYPIMKGSSRSPRRLSLGWTSSATS